MVKILTNTAQSVRSKRDWLYPPRRLSVFSISAVVVFQAAVQEQVRRQNKISKSHAAYIPLDRPGVHPGAC